jgi:cell division protein FtsA
MAGTTNNPMIAGVDIGTSKVVALVGQINHDGELDIIGVGTNLARGMKKGVVVNIEQMVASIRSAISQAELMADCKINSAYVAISGAHVSGRNSQAVVAISEGEVQRSDIARVIDAAKSGPIPTDQQILHILPQEYVVDGQSDVRDPMGMSGVRLEGHVHLMTCSINARQNLEKCVRECDIDINELVFQQLASSYAVLTEDEKEHGICFVDIGGGTTDIVIFKNGAIRHTVVFPVGGDQVTNDIATAFYTPTQDADVIKIKYASAVAHLVSQDDVIEVSGMGDRPARKLSRQTLAEVVEPRYEEIFQLVNEEINRSGYAGKLTAGVVLTGGASRIEGAQYLAESIFHMPVRVGMPKSLRVGGMGEVLNNPVYSTGVGLLLYGKQFASDNHRVVGTEENGFMDFFKKLGEWFAGIKAYFARNF